MAVGIKLLLIESDEPLGNGLAAIRGKESEMIDITDYESAMSDPTITTNPGYVIKDNRVYKVIKTYFDLDKGYRVVFAKEEHNSYDILPTP